METAYIIAINGFVSAGFSFFAYNQSNKKSRIDFLNNQVQTVKAELDNIQEITYKLYQLRFIDRKDIYEDLRYRVFSQKIDSLHNKILVQAHFKDFQEIISEYNIFASNILEADDISSAKIYMNEFDDMGIKFKSKPDQYQGHINT